MTNASLMLSLLKNHELDNVLTDIYGPGEAVLTSQTERYQAAVSGYISLFGDEDIEIYSAPGRTEVCGNHTDHQNGMVLAASINLDVIAVVSKNDSDIVDFVSEGYDPIHTDLSDLSIKEEEAGTTTALIRGVARGLKDRNYNTGGFKAYVTSDVLSGSGLSSSAALEAVIGVIQSGLYNDMSVSSVEIAIIFINREISVRT